MSYSTALAAFERVEHMLDILAKEPDKHHTFPAGDPSKLAYQLRQGIFSANANNIEPHGTLSFRFTAKPDRVEAFPKLATSEYVGTKGLTHMKDKMSAFEVVVDLKKRKLRSGQAVVYEKFKGNPAMVEKFATAEGLTVVSTEPLHIGKE